MAKFKFRLKEGQHVQADRSKPILGADGKPTGRFFPQTFNKGQTVSSDTNLAARFGADKFELLSGPDDTVDPHAGNRTPGDPVPEIAAGSPSHAPGGQVSTGFQVNGGPATAEQAERIVETGGSAADAKPAQHQSKTGGKSK